MTVSPSFPPFFISLPSCPFCFFSSLHQRHSFLCLNSTTPAPSDLIMSPTCAGSSSDSDSCDCTSFVPRKSKKSRCNDCGHRQTHHPDSTADHDNNPTASSSSGKIYVDRVFRSLEGSAVHERARKETLQGFRPQASKNVCFIITYAIRIY